MVRWVDTIVLFMVFMVVVACLTVAFTCSVLIWIEDGGVVVCPVSRTWVGITGWLGAVGIIPTSILFFGQFQRGNFESQNNGSNGLGFVRPSLIRNFASDSEKHSLVQKILLTGHFMHCVSSSAWNFLLGIVLIQLYTSSLSIPATVVICTATGRVWVAPYVAQIMRRLNRLTSVVCLVIVEGVCIAGCALFIVHLFFYEYLNIKQTKSGKMDLLPSWILDDKSPNTSLAQFVHRKQLNQKENMTNVATFWIAMLCSFGSIVRGARSYLVNQDWVRVVAKAESFTNGYDLSPTLSGYGATIGGYRDYALRGPVSSLGTLTPSDEDDDFKSISETPSTVRGYGTLERVLASEETVFFVEPEQKQERSPSNSSHGYSKPDGRKKFRTRYNQVHRVANVLAPLTLGLLLDFDQQALGGSVACLGALCGWMVLATVVEVCAFRFVYESVTGIDEQGPVYERVNFFGAYGHENIYRHISTRNENSFINGIQWALKSFKIYWKSSVFLASISNALLNATVIDCGIVSLAYLRWRALPGWCLGVIVLLKHLPFTFGYVKWIHQCTGSIARTSSLAIWIIWCLLLVCTVAFNLFRHSVSLSFLTIAILITGPSLRSLSLLHAKLVQEWVEEENMEAVLRGQANAKLFATVLMQAMVITHSSPEDYSLLLLTSAVFCFAGVITFSLWYRVYDSGTPFQVVNDIGQLKLVVRG